MRTERLIDTPNFAEAMRARIVRPGARQILISRMAGSDQEMDLTAPPNCDGLGRIRHFRRLTDVDWPANPLPIDPASKALGLARSDTIRAQLFQNAACAWRCWYCYVPFNLLNGDEKRSRWVTAEDLVALYAAETQRAPVIDLSGGSPDLSPEWIVWMMEAMEKAGLAGTTYLWSDDNLSTDYVFTCLSENQRRLLGRYPNYGRVCCFKGFDEASFAFNTGSDPTGFAGQFETFQRYLELGLDLYGYVTLTGPELGSVARGTRELVDRLRSIDEALPLRVVPLRIENFTPMHEREVRRSDARYGVAKVVQEAAIEVWRAELERHFTADQLAISIADVPLRRRP